MAAVSSSQSRISGRRMGWWGRAVWYNERLMKKTSQDETLKTCAPGELSFEFSYCAIFGGGPCVEWDGKKSELRWSDIHVGIWHALPIPRAIQWKAFWQLIDQSGVRKWDHDYSNPNIMDGIEWDFKLTAPGLKVETTGSNAFPGSDSLVPIPGSPFDILATAIGILIGCDPRELKAPQA